MSDVKTAAARLQAASKGYTTWTKGRERLEAERARLDAAIPEIKRQVDEAESAKANAMARYVAGNADQAEVTKARKAYTEADDRLAEHEEVFDAITRGVQNHNDTKYEIDAELKAAKIFYGEALADEQIAVLAGNRKLREDLLRAFIALCYPENADWSLFLGRVFRAPSEDDDLDSLVDAFQAKVKPLTQ